MIPTIESGDVWNLNQTAGEKRMGEELSFKRRIEGDYMYGLI